MGACSGVRLCALGGVRLCAQGEVWLCVLLQGFVSFFRLHPSPPSSGFLHYVLLRPP